jgi:hypothetical protein
MVVALLGLGVAVFGLVQRRALAGIAALLLATCALGVSVLGQVRSEAEIERFIASGGPRQNRAQLERTRHLWYPNVQRVARTCALVALVPLVLGAIAALRRPAVRVVALGFAGLAVFVWGAAWTISHRPLPFDRYAFPEDDNETWALAIALDDIPEGGRDACVNLDRGLRHWPVSPELQAPLRLAAERCLKLTLSEAEFDRHKPRERELLEWLRGSVLIRDWAPDAGAF